MTSKSAAHSGPCPNEAAMASALSRFVDNDLPPQEAADLLLHLQTCLVCQAEYQQMRLAQTFLRHLPNPDAPYGGPEAARVRVMERLHRSVRVGEAKNTANPKGRWMPLWAAGIAAAMACAAGIVFSPRTVSLVPNPMPTPRVALPSQNEMAVLYDLHDAHSATLSASDPADRRDRAAEARAALLRSSDQIADNEAF